ncbi:MAG: hypothetical protein F6K17_34250 [Okeania sp. SIO3C4]|nr:hypothetical protein [Okeania sp. SIO3C4]
MAGYPPHLYSHSPLNNARWGDRERFSNGVRMEHYRTPKRIYAIANLLSNSRIKQRLILAVAFSRLRIKFLVKLLHLSP